MGYYEENREARLKYQKAYNEANKEKISSYFKSYYINNFDEFAKKYQMKKANKKYKINGFTNPQIINKNNNLVTF